MSATEELRQLLDKHGIEWWSDGDISSDHTEWTTDSMSFTSLGMDGDKLAIKTITTMTPRQALDATLGRAIHDDTLRREYESRMNLQRDYNNQCKRIHNQRKQLREMQAALKRGKCHAVSMDCSGNPPYNTSGLSLNFEVVGCSECGTPWESVGMFRGTKLKHNFKACPFCGRLVVE